MEKYFSVNFKNLLQRCMKSKALNPGKQVHGHFFVAGLRVDIESVNSSLVGMYARCGDLTSSMLVFSRMQKPTIFAWNWLIAGYAYYGNSNSAICSFSKMQAAKISPNKFTIMVVLKACVGLLELRKGKEVHAFMTTKGFAGFHILINALIDMYCKCGDMVAAKRLFDTMPKPDVASWTSLINGYSKIGQFEQVSVLFKQMKAGGLEPNEFTWNTIIFCYAHGGNFVEAINVFLRMMDGGQKPDLATWNALISGFTQNSKFLEAIHLFNDMLWRGVKPNSVTIAALLPACAPSGVVQIGMWIHGLMYRLGIELNSFTGSALIDMYCKCGNLQNSKQVFEQIPERNVAVWNAMIGCYGRHGLSKDALELFSRLLEDGLRPNQVTFTCLLSTCSHGGVIENCVEMVNFMTRHKIELTAEHYACIVDAISRCGWIQESFEMIGKIPVDVNGAIAGAFLNGCQMHGRSDLAKKLLDMYKRDWRTDTFVTLSNIYAADGKWGSVEIIRDELKKEGISKQPGYSWTE